MVSIFVNEKLNSMTKRKKITKFLHINVHVQVLKFKLDKSMSSTFKNAFAETSAPPIGHICPYQFAV